MINGADNSGYHHPIQPKSKAISSLKIIDSIITFAKAKNVLIQMLSGDISSQNLQYSLA